MKHWLYRFGWRLLPGVLASGLTLFAAHVGIFQPLEHSIYRFLFQVRGEQPWDERVAVIEIDEASLATIGQFPWPRHYYADLLDTLAPADASVVAFDILFAESAEDDAKLALAMEHHGNVVVATAWDKQRGVIGPNADVMAGAIATGHIHHIADTDGITRTYYPKANGTPALSVAAVQHYSPSQAHGLAASHQSLWLNWLGGTQNAPRYSFADVLNGTIPVDSFSDKIVFVGFTGVGLDTMTTPYNQNPPAAGVYQHVVAANNLLAQNHLKPFVVPVMVLLVLLGPGLGYQLFYRRYRVHLLANLIIVVTWGSAVTVAFHHNYWLPTVAPLGTVVATSFFVRLTERLQGKLKLSQFANIDRTLVRQAETITVCE
ncbi:putative transmembrane sensor domain protein [Leptolyngbya sp. PCC 7375]|nr:putative transmembrane sensor domain protein [Leptolyngbya sp. PCC 7375]